MLNSTMTCQPSEKKMLVISGAYNEFFLNELGQLICKLLEECTEISMVKNTNRKYLLIDVKIKYLRVHLENSLYND